MGVAAGVLIYFAFGTGESDGASVARGLALTCIFGSAFISRRRRRGPDAASTVGELKTVVFAGFVVLMTLGFIIEYIYNHWFR